MSCSALLQSNYRMFESRISSRFPFGFLIATSVPGETPALEAKLTIPPRDRIKKRWSHFIQKVYESDPLICLKWALALPLGDPQQAAIYFPTTCRTQFNSSLIESWGSKTEQPHAQSGSEPN